MNDPAPTTPPAAQPDASPTAPPSGGPRAHGAASLHGLVDTGRSFAGRLRARVIAWTLGLVAAAMVMAAIIGGGWIPVVGTALAAAGLAVNRITARLDKPRCHNCGLDMTDQMITAYGAPCPRCGALNMPGRNTPARTARRV